MLFPAEIGPRDPQLQQFSRPERAQRLTQDNFALMPEDIEEVGPGRINLFLGVTLKVGQLHLRK